MGTPKAKTVEANDVYRYPKAHREVMDHRVRRPPAYELRSPVATTMVRSKRFALDVLDKPVPVWVGVAVTPSHETLQRVTSRKRTLLSMDTTEGDKAVIPPASLLFFGANHMREEEDSVGRPPHYDTTAASYWLRETVDASTIHEFRGDPTVQDPPLHASLARTQPATLSAPDLTFAVLFSQGQVTLHDGGSSSVPSDGRAGGGTTSSQSVYGMEQEGRPPWSALSLLWTAAWDVVDEASREAMQQAREFVDFVSGGCHRRGLQWMALARGMDVKDLPVQPGVTPHDSVALIRADIPRLQGAPQDKDAVESILHRFCESYPGVGYNQGFDSACMAMYLATGRSEPVAAIVFAKWALCTGLFMFHTPEGEKEASCEKAAGYARSVLLKYSPYVFPWLWRDPVMTGDFDISDSEILLANVFLRPLVSLCSRLNFRRGVMNDIVDRVLHLGEDGPAVSLWVACTLLCFAAAEDERDDWGKDEVISVTSRVDQVSAKVTSFEALERAASIPLWTFVGGFRAALGSPS